MRKYYFRNYMKDIKDLNSLKRILYFRCSRMSHVKANHIGTERLLLDAVIRPEEKRLTDEDDLIVLTILPALDAPEKARITDRCIQQY